MKHIVLFSGGCASAYAAYLVSRMENKKDIILLHTPTFSEVGTDKFRCQVARYLKLPITIWGDGRDMDELIEDNNCLPSQFIPFCTQQLKIKMTEEYLKTLDEDYILYYGYGSDEWRRIQKQSARFLQMSRKAKYPIYDMMIDGEKIKKIIEEEWKIKIPDCYKYLKHANCIPCYKSGMKEWRNYWLYYPERFQKAIEHEKKIGHTVFKKYTLEQLVEKWKDEQKWEKMQVSMFEMMDNIPCTCAI